MKYLLIFIVIIQTCSAQLFTGKKIRDLVFKSYSEISSDQYRLTLSDGNSRKCVLSLGDISGEYVSQYLINIQKAYPEEELLLLSSDIENEGIKRFEDKFWKIHFNNRKNFNQQLQRYSPQFCKADIILGRRQLCLCNGEENPTCSGIKRNDESMLDFFQNILSTLNIENKQSFAFLDGVGLGIKSDLIYWDNFIKILKIRFPQFNFYFIDNNYKVRKNKKGTWIKGPRKFKGIFIQPI